MWQNGGSFAGMDEEGPSQEQLDEKRTQPSGIRRWEGWVPAENRSKEKGLLAGGPNWEGRGLCRGGKEASGEHGGEGRVMGSEVRFTGRSLEEDPAG